MTETMTTLERKDARAQGLSRYFTGRPCREGHLDERLVSSGDCVTCKREKAKARYDADPEAVRQKVHNYKLVNREKVKACAKQSIAKNPQRRRDYMRDYNANRRAIDSAYNLTGRLRSRVRAALRLQGGEKAHRTMALVGCTIPEMMAHLEAQFLPGMSWENRSEWHVDHIRSCASFDLLDPDQQRECFHYTNIQPLWAVDNIRKGATNKLEDQPFKPGDFDESD